MQSRRLWSWALYYIGSRRRRYETLEPENVVLLLTCRCRCPGGSLQATRRLMCFPCRPNTSTRVHPAPPNAACIIDVLPCTITSSRTAFFCNQPRSITRVSLNGLEIFYNPLKTVNHTYRARFSLSHSSFETF